MILLHCILQFDAIVTGAMAGSNVTDVNITYGICTFEIPKSGDITWKLTSWLANFKRTPCDIIRTQ